MEGSKMQRYRIRYEVITANGFSQCHAVVIYTPQMAKWVTKIKDAGYRIFGIDKLVSKGDWRNGEWKQVADQKKIYPYGRIEVKNNG